MKFSKATQGSKNAMQLQGIGWVEGTPAGEIKPGAILGWNYGYTSTVLKVVKETAKSIVVESRSDESGNTYQRRFLKTRLVCIVNK